MNYKHPLCKIFFGIILGFGIGVSSGAFADREAKSNDPEQLPVEDVQRFTTAINYIQNFYVEDIPNTKIFEGAIRGMLSSLDPHSAYLDSDELEDLQISTSGEFGGLGIEVGMEDGYVKVISPLDDTPAQKAGILPGDFIARINETPVQGMKLREAVKRMRGKVGTNIHLTVFRKGSEKPINITIVREIIHIQSVKSRMLDKNYGYIRISSFQAHTAGKLNDAIKKLNKKAKLKGVVLDLRNNPGGLLDSAIDVSDTFLDHKKLHYQDLIVYTKGRMQESQFQAKSTTGDSLHGIPMVVLINEGSASASEIVSGALQDQKRAVLMGMPSFGKGSVQTILPLDEKHGIKLTTALYYTPAGRSIQAQGIKPDVQVENIKLPYDEDEMAANTVVKEADLLKHLSNGNKKAREKATDKKEDDKPLIYTDYQLAQALNFLQGVTALQQD